MVFVVVTLKCTQCSASASTIDAVNRESGIHKPPQATLKPPFEAPEIKFRRFSEGNGPLSIVRVFVGISVEVGFVPRLIGVEILGVAVKGKELRMEVILTSIRGALGMAG